MNPRIFNIEFRKMVKFRTFWVLLGLFSVFLILIVMGFQSMKPTEINGQDASQIDFGFYAFPKVWHTVSYLAGYLGLFLALLVIMNISNEFSFRTLRQNIIDGMGRGEFLVSKLLMVLTVSFFATVWIFLTCLIIGNINTGPEGATPFSGMGWAGISFVQILGYLSLAALITLLVRNTGLSMVLFLAWVIFIERVIWLFFPDSIDQFFPSKSLTNLIPFPFPDDLMPQGDMASGDMMAMIPSQAMPTWELAVAGVYIAIFWLLGYFLLKKRDL